MTDTTTPAGRAVHLHDRYPTLTELTDTAHQLAHRRPDRCRVRTIGTSRAGRPLTLLTVGHGPHHILVVSGAHADEFAARAATADLAHHALTTPHPDLTWHFLLCLDPDGAHLAEASRHARTLSAYYDHYYRPAADEQPEWAPAIGIDLPESRTLLDLIDELRPTLQFSLHSTDIGGTFLQATDDPTPLTAPFTRSAAHHGIPVEAGNYDTFHLHESAPGLYLMTPHHIDHQESSTGMLTPTAHTDGGRAGTWFAPRRHGGHSVLIEVPAFTSTRLGDTRPAEAAPHHLRTHADRLRRRGAHLTALLDAARPHLPTPDTPLLRAARTPLTALDQLADAWDPDVHGHRLLRTPMTDSRLTGIDLWSHRLPVRAAALLRRALRAAHAPQAALFDHLLNDWRTRYQQRFHPVWLPVARQAAHQATTVRAAVALRHPRR
ncbi:M14 family zinc carboxypeptidase [Kitasatospora brasiliensis]|uniref:M14 family zinc carboxypeptidase n=1 Tax=Kitasatospora brasiliensis TaxID=3058040 RepID=UPI00292D920B|nr:M14 family zinc carboxypeptidase [Kitasatospora sp. K002]